MKNHIKTLALASLLSAFCLAPLNSAQAHDSWKNGRHQTHNHHARHHHHAKPHRTVKHHTHNYYARHHHHAKPHRTVRYVRHHHHVHKRYPHKRVEIKKVVVHNHAPTKVVYVYKDRGGDDDTTRILAIALAQAALILALD